MCGLCGYVGRPELIPPPEAGRAMNALLVHRGPDGDGELEIAATGGQPLAGWLGHRRLRIIDLSEDAHQPMQSDDGNSALVYNGEVYNFRELRRELEGRGARFRSSGDTEVILRAYEEWGEEFVSRIDGMFALAIWDAREGRLLLARDRTGKKPLYYAADQERIVFASEIKSILAAPWIKPALAEERLGEFLTFGYAPSPRTLYRDVRQLPPGSTISFDADGIHGPAEYWDPLPAEQDLKPTAEVRRNVVELLGQATRRRLISDVPLGAFLSGGIDSSIVVGLMSRASSEPVRTFSIGFPEEPSFDERRYASLVADHFGTRHTEFAVEADALALMDTLLWHHDQPYADSSAIPTYMVSKLARDHVTVALNGDGGDEVFGGYDRFRAARIAEAIPAAAGTALRPLTGILPSHTGYYSVRRRAQRFLERSRHSPEQRYQSWIAVFNEDLLGELMPAVANGAVTSSMDDSYRRAGRLPVLDRILYANFKTYLPDDLAVKMDRMSMANSLETRSPFLDTALIEYVARIPAAQKVGLHRVKPLLRRSFWPLLPKEIWNRRKHGFGVPMGRWFRTDLRQVFEDEVLGSGSLTARYLDQDLMRRLWTQHQAGEVEHGFRFWTVLTLERWLRESGSPRGAPPSVPVLAAG
ncbi:MAG: hypothetical protein QOI10_2618 [Solirubrobacterales bacterium]|jgi:asparagine synthase (glutamine-hydrolysing)|nr:hypothetical protein [Solirubrobacterales bacterium]